MNPELPLLKKAILSPTQFDSTSNFYGSLPEDNFRLLITRTRESDILTEANWETCLKELKDKEGWEVFRIGHWACGWIEYLGILKDSEAYKIASELYAKMKDYPVLNEELLFEKEEQEAQRVWRECYNKKERIEYIRAHRTQFSFYSFLGILECVRGEHFCGYASELIH